MLNHIKRTRLFGLGDWVASRFTSSATRHISRVIIKGEDVAEETATSHTVPYPLTTDKDGFYPLKITKRPVELFRARKFSVTDLTPSYCELLSLYEKCLGEQRTSAAMVVGTQIHAQLEQTAITNAKIKVIELPRDVGVSKEEAWACKIINQITNLQALKDGHTIRELYVHAIVNGYLVTGYIDEVIPDKGSLFIVDTKTRSLPQEPELSQQLSAYHQVQLYYEILRQMTVESGKSFGKIYSAFQLDALKQFTPEFCQFLNQATNSDVQYTCLKSLEEELRPLLEYFKGQISKTLRVEYLKRDGQIVGTATYQFDQSALEELLEFTLGFWEGTRYPIGVDESEINKCKRCPMKNRCKWTALLDERLSRRGR